jgi:hypothetical protein
LDVVDVLPSVEDGEAAQEAGLDGEEARDEAELVTMEDAGLAVLLITTF